MTQPAGASDGATAREWLRAFERAKAAADVEAMAAAARGLARGHVFGSQPGRAPAMLDEAYRLATEPARTRLAIELARVWVYGADPSRAAAYAEAAATGAEALGDDALLADALDAELLVHWGPDDLAERLRITTRLEDVATHLSADEPRLTAHLWRLTTALEGLDAATVRRQIRALEQLAEESDRPRTRFLAASRSAMYALMVGDTERAAAACADTIAAGHAAGEPDTPAIEHVLRSGLARHRGDLATMRSEAEQYERFGVDEGVLSVTAEAAGLWCEVGEPARAAPLVTRIAGAGLERIPRDQDWLLTVTSVGRAAGHCALDEIAAQALDLLVPYAGRAVVDAGAVAFDGVVDDHLAVICAALGRPDAAAAWQQQAARLYDRIGARWWRDRLGHVEAPPPTVRVRALLRQEPSGLWSVGLGGAVTPLRGMRGFQYLRVLLAAPGHDFGARELSDAVRGHAGHPEAVAELADDVIDRQALAAYRRRLAELDEELDEALSWADEGRRVRMAAEREALLSEVRAATGLGHRVRSTPSAAERARVAVRKALAAAIERITSVDPALGRLLSDCIETGTYCRYRPDPSRPTDWVLG